jgi:hypothetical protein
MMPFTLLLFNLLMEELLLGIIFTTTFEIFDWCLVVMVHRALLLWGRLAIVSEDIIDIIIFFCFNNVIFNIIFNSEEGLESSILFGK